MARLTGIVLVLSSAFAHPQYLTDIPAKDWRTSVRELARPAPPELSPAIRVAPVSADFGAVEQDNRAQSSTTQYRPIQEKQALEVNTRNVLRDVVYKSEQAGQQDLRKIATQSIFEESFLFYPLEEKWVEIGYQEELFEKGTRTKIDKDYLEEALRSCDELIRYHPHPSLTLFGKRTSPIHEALPSSVDIKTMALINELFAEVNPDCKFSSKIVSQYGVTEFSFTLYAFTQLRNEIQAELNGARLPKAKKYYTRNFMYMFIVLGEAYAEERWDEIREQHADVKNALVHMAEQASSNYFSINFIGFE